MTTIVLIGPPGAGKSTVGKALSKRLNLNFIDTDQLIEERSGKSITEIFLDSGEAEFRSLEREVVLESLNKTNLVVALGGGSVLDAEVQSYLS